MDINFQVPTRGVKLGTAWAGPRHLGDTALAEAPSIATVKRFRRAPGPRMDVTTPSNRSSCRPSWLQGPRPSGLLTAILVSERRSPYLRVVSELRSGPRSPSSTSKARPFPDRECALRRRPASDVGGVDRQGLQL